MRRKILSILLGITLAGTLLCACSGASLEDAASVMKEDLEKDAKWAREHNAGGDEYDQEVADQLIDSVENIDENVYGVKNGYPSIYPDITYEMAFDAFFDKPTWDSFVGVLQGTDDDEDGEPDYFDENISVVEFTGDCMYGDEKRKAVIQFKLDGDTFSAEYLSLDGVPQSKYMLNELIEMVFEQYADENNISKADSN